jgi:hypothetical protein
MWSLIAQKLAELYVSSNFSISEMKQLIHHLPGLTILFVSLLGQIVAIKIKDQSIET